MIKVYQVQDQEAIFPKTTFTYGMGDIGWDPLVDDNFSKYDHVANIATDDLSSAYRIGNIGPEGDINRKASMHSISVGDILEKENGERYIVARSGFDKLEVA